ncbi:hypothetical protein HDE_11124 [Halotydeus destructor]|nr:hypothetical protein HDE_11124 [Halotydeus destructor]
MQLLVILVAILSPMTSEVTVDHNSGTYLGPVSQAEPTCQSKMDVVFVFSSATSSSDFDRSLTFAEYLSDKFKLNTSRIGFVEYSSRYYQMFSLEESLSVMNVTNHIDIYSTAANISEAIDMFNEAEGPNGDVAAMGFLIDGHSGVDADRAAGVLKNITTFAVELALKDGNDTELITIDGHKVAPSRGDIYQALGKYVEKLIGITCEHSKADSGATDEGDGSGLTPSNASSFPDVEDWSTEDTSTEQVPFSIPGVTAQNEPADRLPSSSGIKMAADLICLLVTSFMALLSKEPVCRNYI